MATVQFGRIGLDVSFANAITGYQETSTYDEGRQVTFSGLVKTSTLADTIALRTELPALSGQLVPVIWSFDSTLNGYYAISDVSIDASAASGSYVSGGLFGLTITAKLIGSDGDVEFQSKLVGTVLSNTKGVTDAESTPWHSPPVGAYGWTQVGSSPTHYSRTTSDGAIDMWHDISRSTSPTWSVDVADFYKGAVKVYTGGYLRQGLHTANVTSGWELSNGLVKVTPNGTNGRLDLEVYDGSQWDTPMVVQFWSSSSEIGNADAIAIIRNRPESCVIRLTRDAYAELGGGRWTIDLELRRGSRYISGYYTSHVATDLTVIYGPQTAGTGITPTGASAAVAVLNNTTVNGNRFVVGSANSAPQTSNTSVATVSTTAADFFIGAEVNYTASAPDRAQDLCLQHLGHISESVRVLRR